MDPKLSQLIIDMLSQTKEFILAQAPDTIQQMIGWAILQHSVAASILGVICLGLIGGALYFWRKAIKEDDDYVIGTIVCGILALLFFGISLGETLDAVQAGLYPKAYLMDMVTKSK